MEGVQIGGYRVLRQIGEGGMGAVWMAEHAMLGRRAAIKILHPSFSTRQDIVTRFFNEARAATAIADPGIIQIFDFGFHTDGSAYIVMELLDGEPLDRRLQRLGALPIGDALRLCRQVASTVGAAHAQGITHRDLKPENIFIIRDPEVAGGERAKVLDFGIAKLAGELGAQQKTNASAVMGTPLYMSPEQCRGAGKVDQRSDVYSLGCVMFALVTGFAPFIAEGTGEIIMRHMIEPPPRPSTRLLGVPPEVDDLILRCLAKDSAERFASGTELAMAIDKLIGRPAVPHIASITGNGTSRPTSDTTLGSSAAFVASASIAAPRSRTKLYAVTGMLLAVGGVTTALLVSGASLEPSKPPPPEATAMGSRRPEVASSPALTPTDSRQTQAKADIHSLFAAFSKWAADRAGSPCPTNENLGGHVDPWGHAYQLTCTDQPADQTIGAISLGPDGILGSQDDLTSWTLGRDVTELVHGKRWGTPPAVVTATALPAAARTTPAPAPTPALAHPTPNPVPTHPAPNSAPAHSTPNPAPTQPAPEKPAAKKPSTPAAPRQAKPAGIVDLDGDGIPDTR
jgi:serine/threonine protein kinase